VQSFRSTHVRSVSFFFGLEISEIDALIAGLDASCPGVAVRLLLDTLQAMPTYDAPIHQVLAPCRGAQIAPAVVRTIAVDVVDILSGPSAGYIKPSEPVREVAAPINADANALLPIAITGKIAHGIANDSLAASLSSAREEA